MPSGSTDSFDNSSAKVTPGAAMPNRDNITMYATTIRPFWFGIKNAIVLCPPNVSGTFTLRMHPNSVKRAEADGSGSIIVSLLQYGNGLFVARWSDCSGRNRYPEVFNQCTERLRNGPCLRRTSSWLMGRIPIENFRYLPETGFLYMRFYSIEKGPTLRSCFTRTPKCFHP